jgi:hypothetical protein
VLAGCLRHELAAERAEEHALGVGDTAGLYYTLYELPLDVPIQQAVREAYDTNADAEITKVKGQPAPRAAPNTTSEQQSCRALPPMVTLGACVPP